jgi:N-acyl-D-amino-acid deacylase
VIKGGTVADGSGSVPRTTDVAITGGVIAAVGDGLTSARIIDASWPLVRSMCIPTRTVRPRGATSSTHISAMGDIAGDGPLGGRFRTMSAGEQQTLIERMEGVEDTPGAALHEGVPWGARVNFPEYLDFLDPRSYSLEVGASLAHSALRFHVMRDRGVRNQDATEVDVAAMRELAARAIAAGTIGLSTSRTIFHRSLDASAVPATRLAQGSGLRDRTRGAQISIEFLVEKQTRGHARLYGLDDGGTLEKGVRAELNVIAFDNL